MTRYPHLDSLPLPPGHCFVCRTAAASGYTDTGVQDDFLGAFYVCDDDVKEWARGLGWVSGEHVAELRAELGQARVEIGRLGQQLMNLLDLDELIERYANARSDAAAERVAAHAGRRGGRRGGGRPAQSGDANPTESDVGPTGGGQP